MTKTFLWPAAAFFLISCAQFPGEIKKSMDNTRLNLETGSASANGVYADNFGPLHVLQSYSYIPGDKEIRADSFSLIFKAVRDGVFVDLYLPKVVDPIFKDRSLNNYIDQIAAVPVVIKLIAGIDTHVDRIKIMIIPKDLDARFDHHDLSYSFGREHRHHVTFAAIWNADIDELISQTIRTLAHELTHAALAFSGIKVKGLVNERTASTMENCVELSILGTTSLLDEDDSRFYENTDKLYEAMGNTTRHIKDNLDDSISGRYERDVERNKIFKEGTVAYQDVERRSRLLELCRSRIDELRR